MRDLYIGITPPFQGGETGSTPVSRSMLDLDWIKWSPEQINSAVERGLAFKRRALEEIYAVADDERTFANTVAAIQYASDDLNDLQQRMDLMVMVHPQGKTRDAAQTAVERIESANIEMESDRRLWQAVSVWDSRRESLDALDGRLADDLIRDLRRVGFHLPDDKFNELKEVRQKLQKLSQEFERTINEYEDHIEVALDELAGLPERYISGLKQTPDGKYIVSLQYPEFFPFMEFADNDAKRRELAVKNLRKGGQENLSRLAEMIALRQRQAELLGYSCHADYVQEVYMARNSTQVDAFLSDIIRKLRSGAQQDFRELVAVKKHYLNLQTPKPIHFHEIAYWSNKLKKDKYALDPEALKEYFPLEHVVSNMLAMYQEVLGLKFEKVAAVLWHQDAELYSVSDAATGRLLGHFALDLYPREGKYGHAATFPVALGRRSSTGEQVPGFVALVCNYSKPTADNPSLLSPDGEGAETLLHEFGHVVHALVSCGRWQRQNGFGTPLDFVETPSQMFEYWIWEPESLRKLSHHYATGQVIPDELIDKMLLARKHHQASYNLAQAVRSLYDLRIHSRPTDSEVPSEQLAKEYIGMKLDHESIELPEDSLFPAGWGHMSDYDAGYYSYLWSKVFSTDLFTRFSRNPLDPQVGSELRTKVLEPGASSDEKKLVADFLGRPGNDEAFLKELGL